MDKDTVKSFISSLSAGDTVCIGFAGDMSSQTGEYKVLGLKTGRGKGGSKLVELQATVGGALLTTGTPHSNVIMNLQRNGDDIIGGGSQSECNVPYERDLARSEALKTAFINLRDTHLAVPGENDVKVNVDSTAEFLKGNFKVTGVTTKRGRHGQMVLHLENVDSGRKEEIWSHRHSGVINRIDVSSTPRVEREVV